MRGSQQVDVNGALALASWFHFLYGCSTSCVLPFLTLYLRRLGLTPAMVGAVMAARHLLSLLCGPLGGLLARVYAHRKLVVAGSLALSAGAALVVLLIPHAGAGPEMLIGRCNLSLSPAGAGPNGEGGLLGGYGTVRSVVPGAAVTGSVVPGAASSQASKLNVNGTLLTKAFDDDNDKNNNTNSTHPSGRRGRSLTEGEPPMPPDAEEDARFEFLGSLKAMDAQHQLFFLLLIVASLWAASSAPLEWALDDGLHEYLDSVDASDRSGEAAGGRGWALLGGAVGVGGAGLLVSRFDCRLHAASSADRGALHFYLYAALTGLALPLAAFLSLRPGGKRERSSGATAAPLRAARLVRGDARALLCAATVFLAGAAQAVMDDYLLWAVAARGGGELQMGLSLGAGLLSRAAFPRLAALTRLTRLLGPPGRTLVLGVGFLALQALCYSLLWGPWAALPPQLLSCLGSGALWWAVEAQVEDVATPGAERWVRRLYRMLALDLGAGLGSLAAGAAVQRVGVAWTFRGVSLALAVWGACLPLLQWKAPRQRRINYSRLLAAGDSEVSESESEQERDWLDKAMDDDRSNNNQSRRRDQQVLDYRRDQ